MSETAFNTKKESNFLKWVAAELTVDGDSPDWLEISILILGTGHT